MGKPPKASTKGGGTRGWLAIAHAHQICMLVRILGIRVDANGGAQKVNVGHSPVQA